MTIQLDGSVRESIGGAASRRSRKEGQIPAVMYGENGNNIYFSVPAKEFNKEYLKGNIETKTIELNLDGKKFKVLVHQLDIDPLRDLPRHIDFINLDGKKEIKVLVPVEIVGRERSPGIRRGGFLHRLKRKIPLYVDPKNIPQKVELDISTMHIGTSVKVLELTLPEGTRSAIKPDIAVIAMTGRGGKGDKAEEEAAGGAVAPAAKK